MWVKCYDEFREATRCFLWYKTTFLLQYRDVLCVASRYCKRDRVVCPVIEGGLPLGHSLEDAGLIIGYKVAVEAH